jgi:hypothetical protein
MSGAKRPFEIGSPESDSPNEPEVDSVGKLDRSSEKGVVQIDGGQSETADGSTSAAGL